MTTARVVFKLDPSIVVAERTDLGPGFDPRVPLRPLKDGPFLAAFDAGIPFLRDIAGPDDRAYLVQVDSALLAAIEHECDTIIVDLEDL